MLDHLNVGEEINHFAKTPLVQLRTGKVFRKNIFEALVFFLNTAHCIINHRANFRRVSGSSNRAPSCILRNKEDVFGCVFILVFFKSIAFFNQFLVLCLEAIRNVFQKNQSENDRLIFGCVDVPAQDASRVPDLFFKADIACISSHSAFLPYISCLYKVYNHSKIVQNIEMNLISHFCQAQSPQYPQFYNPAPHKSSRVSLW